MPSSQEHELRAAKEVAEAQASEERRLREQERELMGMVSHGFRTPLSISKAMTHNLNASPGIDGHARERVRKIQRASLRLAELMNGYLSLEPMRSVDQALQVRRLHAGPSARAGPGRAARAAGPPAVHQ